MKTVEKSAVIISCFDWYEQRLIYVEQYLRNKGYAVTILTSDFHHHSKTKIEKRFHECEYIEVRPYKKNMSMERMASHSGFAKKAYTRLKELVPDVIYALIPPNSVGRICTKYKKEHPECCLMLDIIDLWPESMPIDRISWTPPYKIWKKYRDSAIQVADYIYTECKLYQQVLKEQLMGKKASVLHLYKPQEKIVEEFVVKSLKADEDVTDEKTKIWNLCYLGSMNYIMDIDSIGEVIAAMSRQGQVVVHMIGDGEKREELQNQITVHGGQYKYYGKVYDELEKAKIMSQCDFGINMMKNTVKVGLTIKSMDYLSCGLPLLNNIQGDTWSLVEKEQVGINFAGDTKDFVEQLKVWDLKSAKVAAYESYRKNFTIDAFRNNVQVGFESVLKKDEEKHV